MATKEELKAVFVTGAVPTQQNFADLIDVAGSQGPKGDTGAKGADGAKGDAGAKGTAGTKGADGVSVTGASSDGTNITFTLSSGGPIVIPWPAQG